MNAAQPTPKRKRKRKPAPPLPAPRFSACVYLRMPPANVAMFRFLLEAEDNLAYMSTVDRWASVVRVTFSPHQTKTVMHFFESMRESVEFEYVCDGLAI